VKLLSTEIHSLHFESLPLSNIQMQAVWQYHIDLLYDLHDLFFEKCKFLSENIALTAVAYPGIFFEGGCSTNSVEDRGQREWGSGAVAP